MNLLEVLFSISKCDHDFDPHGWSYIKCKKCGKVKMDLELSAKLRNKQLQRMAEFWGKDEINKGLIKRKRFKEML